MQLENRDRLNELLIELRWRRCKKDFLFFFRNFWMIQHPEQGAIHFDPFDAQLRALNVLENNRKVITLKARQIGWTTLMSAYAFWLTFFYSDRSIIFLSRNEREAVQILRKAKYGYKRLPPWLLSRGPLMTADNQMEMPFKNGSSIESLPSRSDPARGRTVYLVVVDEWAFLDNQEDAWSSIEPVADVGGRVFALSTANGYGNFFHTMWVEATTGVSDFVPIFEPWSARDDRSPEWYEDKKKSLPEHKLHQEYPRNPEEAFLKSGNAFFDLEKLATLTQVEPSRGFMANRDGVTFVRQSGGDLAVWALPDPTRTYVIGVDTAEGLEHGDFSSAHVLDAFSGELVAHYHGRIEPGPYGEDVIDPLGRYYNNALVGVEANNHGHTTIDRLKTLRYPHLFYHRITDERAKRTTNKAGWQTTKSTRGPMLDDLGEEVRRDGLLIHCKHTIAELRTFVRDEKGRLHGSPYDDRTMSLAIANQMRDYASRLQTTGEKPGYWTLGWFIAEDDKLRKKIDKQPIGAYNVR